MPAETIVAGWTVKEFDAAFKAVSETWRRKGCHEERREPGRSLFGRSIEYRFYQGGAEIVRWEMRSSASGVVFVVRLQDADIYEMPDWDRFAWQTKEAIWRDVMMQIRGMFPNKGPTRVEGERSGAQTAAGKAGAGAPATSERFFECVQAVEVVLEPGDSLDGAEPELPAAWQAGVAPEVQRPPQGTAAQSQPSGGARRRTIHSRSCMRMQCRSGGAGASAPTRRRSTRSARPGTRSRIGSRRRRWMPGRRLMACAAFSKMYP